MLYHCQLMHVTMTIQYHALTDMLLLQTYYKYVYYDMVKKIRRSLQQMALSM